MLEGSTELPKMQAAWPRGQLSLTIHLMLSTGHYGSLYTCLIWGILVVITCDRDRFISPLISNKELRIRGFKSQQVIRTCIQVQYMLAPGTEGWPHQTLPVKHTYNMFPLRRSPYWICERPCTGVEIGSACQWSTHSVGCSKVPW